MKTFLVVVFVWYAYVAYHIYLRHIDRKENPRPDRALAALAWLVSPLVLATAVGAAIYEAIEEAQAMATGPGVERTEAPKGPEGQGEEDQP